MTLWMVRAGRGGDVVTEFQSHGVVAFGDGNLGKLKDDISKEDLLRLYAERMPVACPQKAGPLEKLGFTLEGEEPECEKASSQRSRSSRC